MIRLTHEDLKEFAVSERLAAFAAHNRGRFRRTTDVLLATTGLSPEEAEGAKRLVEAVGGLVVLADGEGRPDPAATPPRWASDAGDLGGYARAILVYPAPCRILLSGSALPMPAGADFLRRTLTDLGSAMGRDAVAVLPVGRDPEDDSGDGIFGAFDTVATLAGEPVARSLRGYVVTLSDWLVAVVA